ncbi:uncharacterized protein si:dkey-283b1.6 isoform X2 [Myxocyprinus asiaticus]|uniref:uncharacterized protein si:dkey-283b1.6 isoform X2 n=1 Tax=Myxocyprinus asiaticus TaxID=70543 RepID=UPI002223A8BC|nr:uncharacterized protein si:dkey-283b1.6 isoform X2 [Myxocyprinus asiaticus]
MEMSYPFPVFQIFIPIVTCAFLAICCVSFCKFFQRARKERLERLAAQAQALEQVPVYVIPMSLSEDDLHRPPRYSTVQFYDPPPAYNELKPEAFPVEPPPAYSESVSPPSAHL